eukprot:gene9747-20270_t
MGSSSSILATVKSPQLTSSVWTVEEQNEITLAMANQRRGAEFATEYMFYGVPVTTSRATADPLSPLWIQLDTNTIRELAQANSTTSDEKIFSSVPTTVMILSNGQIRTVFSRTSVQYELCVKDIQRAMDDPNPMLPMPKPPFLKTSKTDSLDLGWDLMYPPGVLQRVELQYALWALKVNDRSDDPDSQWQWLALTSKSWESPQFQSHLMDALPPGRSFLFRLRYWIPRGWSSYSIASIPFVTLPAPPDPPPAPFCGILLPDTVQICWSRPKCNGTPITGFVLRGRGVGHLYRGPRLHFLALHLHPECPYSFEVAAVNKVGQSKFSIPLSLNTPSRAVGNSSGGTSSSQQALLCAQAWRECFNPSDNSLFYFNVITGTRQTERPAALGTDTTNINTNTNTTSTYVVKSSEEDPDDSEDLEVREEREFRVKRFRFLRKLLLQSSSDGTGTTGTGNSPSQRDHVNDSDNDSGRTVLTTTNTRSSRDPPLSLVLSLRRDKLLLDVYRQLSVATPSLLRGGNVHGRRQRTKVQFVGEAGIDAGGPAREFFLLSSQGLVDIGLRQGWLRSCSKEGTIFFQTPHSSGTNISKEQSADNSLDTVPAEKLCALLGRLCGLALLDRQLVAVPMASAWLQQLLTGEGSAVIGQLGELEGELGQSLQWMLRDDVDITDVIFETFSVSAPLISTATGKPFTEDIVELSRSTSSSMSMAEGRTEKKKRKTKTKEKRIALCYQGEEREVTQENKSEYVNLMVQWHTCYSVAPLVLAFLQSFHELVPLSVLRTSELNTEQLSQLLGGRPVVDVDLLRAHAVYQSSSSSSNSSPSTLSFSGTHFVCVWFWEAMRGMSEKDQRCLLRFITGSGRIPLDGFEPPLNITQGEDMVKDSLPKTHTCFNQLVLPLYSSFDTLKEKVLFAVQNADSFELS